MEKSGILLSFILSCFLLLSGVSPCYAQRLLPNPETDALMRQHRQRQQDQKNMKSHSVFNEDHANNDRHWKVLLAVTETQYLMVRKDGSECYFGEIRNSNRAICHGQGIIKVSDNEYCLCQWKRDSRHGKGFIRREDGNVVACEWRWNAVVKDSIRPASEEETAQFNDAVDRLEKLMKLVRINNVN